MVAYSIFLPYILIVSSILEAILDTEGSQVLKMESSGTSAMLDVSALSSGVYVIKVHDEHGGIALQKFVKK